MIVNLNKINKMAINKMAINIIILKQGEENQN